MKPLTEALASLEFGEPMTFQNVSMLPLLGGRTGEPDYITLDDALAARTAQISEVSEAGSVPELRFENAGAKAVLLLDGEELVGAKQNRILNLTILAPAYQTLTIPVSCVEQGRWAHRTRDFATSPRTHYAAGRARKMASVTASLARSGERHSDQGEVWRDIGAKSERLAAASPTGAMAEMYEQHNTNLDAFVHAMEPVSGQVGALFRIGGRMVGFDLFEYPDTLAKLLPKLVRSCALDALDPQREDATAATHDDPRHFLAALRASAAEVFPAVGEGEDVRLTAPGLAAGALIARGRLIHLSAFSVGDATGQPHSAETGRLARPSVRCRLRSAPPTSNQ